MLPRTLCLLLLLISLVHGRDLDVISYNVRYDAKNDTRDRDWQARKKLVADFLKKGEIIGLQEGLAHQIDELNNALPNHTLYGVGRSDGKKSGEFTAIFFDNRQWKLDPTENGTFWLSDTPDKPGSTSWGNQITRICTWARLIDPNGVGIYVFNTHWDHKNQESRVQAAHQLITKLQQRRYIDEPVIVMGDLNASIENKAVKLLLESTDWRKRNHIVDHTPQVTTYNGWKPAIQEGLRIDHIFTSPFLPIEESKVLANGSKFPGSDHHPVISSITWDSNERKEFLDRHYIEETLLGKEHGGGKGFVVCWPAPATVRMVTGSDTHKAVLKSIIDELNSALTGTEMSYTISETAHKNELRVYFADSSELTALGKKENYDLPANVDGFAGLTWTTETKQIESASVFIASDKSEGKFLRHVVLEEVTQTLGLMGDTSVYPESVTYSRYEDQGHAPKLGQCDINALRLIYGHLQPADTALKTGISYARYWGK